jgi:hypothetical protein
VRHRRASGQTLRGLTELLGLDCAIHPAVEDLYDGCSRLQTLGAHRPDGIGSYMCPTIDHNSIGYRRSRRDQTEAIVFDEAGSSTMPATGT